MEEERRRAQRFPVNIKTEYCNLPDAENKEAFRDGLIVNLSKTGLLLTTPTPLGLGSKIVMMFDIVWERTEVPVGVLGTIVREQAALVEERPEAYAYGVQFTSPRMAV